MNVINTESQFILAHGIHDIYADFSEIYFCMIPATIDNPVESWRMYLLRTEPHSAFFVRSELTVLKKVKECWNFRDKFLKKTCIIIFERI